MIPNSFHGHVHVCVRCGHTWRASVKVPATPLQGQFRKQQLQIDPLTLILAGSGQKLRALVEADWVRALEAVLHDGAFFGWSREHGVVAIEAETAKELAEMLGDGFVSVAKGVLVSLDACLVADFRERMCGLADGLVDGKVSLQWVRCSRRGVRQLRARLSGVQERAVGSVPVPSASDTTPTDHHESP